MDQVSNVLSIIQSDYEINQIIKKCKVENPAYTMHFSQNEDFFLKTGRRITIPHLDVHHDINKPLPDKKFIAKLYEILTQITPMIGDFIENTSYFFDPAELLKPSFYRLYRHGTQQYLYILRIDLGFKPHDCEILEKGGNDTTHTFQTENIYLEADILPVENIQEKIIPAKTGKLNRLDFIIKQSISQTWIGETGRGYFIQGIWMDSELTKFFSSLFLPDNLLTYPYYPFPCKYRTICCFPYSFSEEERLKHIKMLDNAVSFLDPCMEDIEEEFKSSVFSRDMGLFKKLKKNIDPEWYIFFRNIKIRRYLNQRSMREYELCT